MNTDLLRPTAITRRDFVKISGAALAILGLSQALRPRMVKALENAPKPAVIWLEGQDCAGCTESFLNSLEPDASAILLNKISLRYHETAMAGSGYKAEEALQTTIAQGGYLLVIEGSIPMAEDGLYCQIGGKTFKDIVSECAKNAAAIVAVGACASYGGIPRSGPTHAVGYLFDGTKKHGYFDDVTGTKPVINLPTCPVHPERLVAVITYYIAFGKIPPLDEFNRPVAFYGKLQHDNCERRGHFDAGRFMTDWGDSSQKDWCLYLKGCRGPWAHQDCWQRLWNQGTNYCIRANAPCVGCSEPEFYEAFSPLYKRQFDVNVPGVGKTSIDKVMATVAGVAAAGIGASIAVDKLMERKEKGHEETKEEPKA